MRNLLLLPVIALLVLGGCDRSPTAPAVPSIVGTWTGSSLDLTLNVNLTDSGGTTVGGSGTLRLEGEGNFPFTVTGDYAFPNVTLTFNFVGFEPLFYRGEMANENLIAGYIHEPGFLDFAVNLRRQ